MLSSRYLSRARSLLSALLLLPIAAIAQGRNVTGTYNTTINSPQGAVKAVIVLKRDAGAFIGTLAADGFPTIPVTNVVPSDSGVSMQGDSPDGAVMVKMKFGAADKVTGTVLYQGAEMMLDGTFASGTAAMSAAGMYELKSTEPLLGMAEFPVTCAITAAADGSYSGTCGNDQGAAPVGKIVVDGSVVTMTGDSPAGPFRAVITIEGKAATGTLQLGAETAKMKGTFTPK